MNHDSSKHNACFLHNRACNEMAELSALFRDRKRCLVVLHNNPDPDALASGLALKFLVEFLFGVETSIAYDGIIGRAENINMVRLLKIKLKRLNRIRLNRYDCVAVVDSQPGAGNNNWPVNKQCQLVIDHHPIRKRLHADLVYIDPSIGASATRLVEWFHAAKIPLPANIATALLYAIRSETQDLGRDAEDRDIAAYRFVHPRASMRLLAKISYPKRPRMYFKTLAWALDRTYVFRHLICAHLGTVHAPEMVAEIADLLIQHQRMSWCLCSGLYQKEMIISMRSSNPKAKAGKIIKKLVPDPNMAGGHDMFAGGKIKLKKNSEPAAAKLMQDFARIMGYDNAEWKPLMEEDGEKSGN
ncbi:DHH family phosphoesterase [candidate division KSB1 bacterium]|nr:DHH family phosphoesterase [candidate division KSB1 bacterium]